MSTHRVDVVRLGPVEKHPNADSLGITKIFDYTAIVRLGDYSEGDLVAYIEPDYVVPEAEQFAFLGGNRRIRSKKLRGVWSQGLVIRAPEGASEGDDVMEALGIVRYEPPSNGNGWTSVRGPNPYAEPPHPTLAHLSKYDLEPYRKFGRHVLEPGESVIITEKIHGTNARYAWRDGRMWCGSRTHWRKRPEDGRADYWWDALSQHPWIEAFCRANPSSVLFGEVYGHVQDLRYGAKDREYRFAAFDAHDANGYWPFEDLAAECAVHQGHTAPILFGGAVTLPPLERLEEVSRGDSILGPNMSEGIVIKPVTERWHQSVGRVALKLISDRYLERAK
jgi:RNA ligase (TIGR02306 family)